MKKKKNSIKISLTKKPINFHSVQKFPPLSTMTIQIPKLPKIIVSRKW